MRPLTGIRVVDLADEKGELCGVLEEPTDDVTASG